MLHPVRKASVRSSIHVTNSRRRGALRRLLSQIPHVLDDSQSPLSPEHRSARVKAPWGRNSESMGNNPSAIAGIHSLSIIGTAAASRNAKAFQPSLQLQSADPRLVLTPRQRQSASRLRWFEGSPETASGKMEPFESDCALSQTSGS